ncbi:MAG: VOC family protein [Gemmatimonadaceae bacterium]
MRGAGVEGTVKRAEFTIAGHRLACIASLAVYAFSFTPSMSLFLDVAAENAITNVFATLSEGGQVLMPLDNYGFSRSFGFVSDRFGVSWQLNLP